MANVKITELTAATALAGTDVLPIVDVGADATKKVSVSDLLRNLPDGTASAPALAFADDQNTGVLSPGNNSLAFATSGTQRLVINSAGQIDINSNCRIEEDGLFKASNGSAAAPSHAFLNDPDNGMFRATTNTLGFSTGGSERLRIDSSGNVGIGTTSPTRELQVSAAVPQVALLSSDSTICEYLFGDVADDNVGRIRYEHATNNLNFWTNANERLRIDSSGRLLVGTSSAFGGNNEMLQVARSGGGAIALLRNDTSVSSGNELGAISWYGNDSTASTYQECATIRAFADGAHADNDKPTRITFSTTADNASSPTERMRISESGQFQYFTNNNFNVRTSQTSSTYGVFYVRNNASSTLSGTTQFVVNATGNVQNTNNSYGAISDIKLKENIVDANSQWDDFKAIRFRKYNFKEETGYETFTQLGVIAQELEQVCPGLVDESPDIDDDGNDLGTVTKSVNYSVLYMKAVKALQEAMDRIETLEAKVAALEAQ